MAKAFPGTGATVIDSVADLPAASAALEGVMMFQKDTNELKICDGSSWISMLDTDNKPMDAWTDWTGLIVSQSNNVSFTFNYSRYLKLGKLVHWIFGVAITGTGTAGVNVTINMPFAPISQATVVGSGWIYDASTATRYVYVPELNGLSTWTLSGDWSGPNSWGVAPNAALANSDQIRGCLIYEAAS